MKEDKQIVIEAWDPLESASDPGMIVAAQRREIRNILKSYTGYYDLFSELIQNALDAVERRLDESEPNLNPSKTDHQGHQEHQERLRGSKPLTAKGAKRRQGESKARRCRSRLWRRP